VNDPRSAAARLLTRAGWLAVLVPALGMSCWSLFYVARSWGVPPWIAVGVSACFDGLAIVAADLALRYARTHGDSGLGARLTMLAAMAVSAYLNSQHAAIVHAPWAARVLYAGPPVAACLAFELAMRYQRRGALRAAGRVAPALPMFGRMAWCLFPLRTMRALRSVVAQKIDRVEAEATGRDRRPVLAPADVRKVRAWAKSRGLNVAESGPLPDHVLQAYAAATAAVNGHPLALTGKDQP
jgi:Protein of unknown function (DUF2637)